MTAGRKHGGHLVTRDYFHQRAGVNPQRWLDRTRLNHIVGDLIASFRSRGYFQQHFGYRCVDAGVVPGIRGSSIATFLLLTANISISDPVESHIQDLSDVEVLGLLEALRDVVSQPQHGHYHTFSSCGWHYSTFLAPDGQREYTEAVNQFLKLWPPGYIMNDAGTIELAMDEPMADLVDEPLPPTTPPAVRQRIAIAIERFRRGRSTWEDRHAAVRDLADALEFVRTAAERHLVNRDEHDIFALLNSFGIRHLRADQRLNYDKPIFLKWAFYYCLAALHACLELEERSEASLGPTS